MQRIITLLLLCLPLQLPAATGGLRLTSHAPVAVPRSHHEVFLTWRYLIQDGGLDSAYDVERSTNARGGFSKIATAQQNTTYLDSPGSGTYYYRIKPTAGTLSGQYSRVVKVTTCAEGRDWIELLSVPTTANWQRRIFADTDGDGEMEFATYTPLEGSSEDTTFKIQVYNLFNAEPVPKWSFDTGIKPYKVETTVHRGQDFAIRYSCFDVTGDFKANIIGMAKVDGAYKLVVLEDMGTSPRIAAIGDLPFPLPLDSNEARIIFAGANLGGANNSIIVRLGDWARGGRHMHVWAYDVEGAALKSRWHVSTSQNSYQGMYAGAHSMAILDIDGDGKDEIVNGGNDYR